MPSIFEKIFLAAVLSWGAADVRHTWACKSIIKLSVICHLIKKPTSRPLKRQILKFYEI